MFILMSVHGSSLSRLKTFHETLLLKQTKQRESITSQIYTGTYNRGNSSQGVYIVD